MKKYLGVVIVFMFTTNPAFCHSVKELFKGKSGAVTLLFLGTSTSKTVDDLHGKKNPFFLHIQGVLSPSSEESGIGMGLDLFDWRLWGKSAFVQNDPLGQPVFVEGPGIKYIGYGLYLPYFTKRKHDLRMYVGPGLKWEDVSYQSGGGVTSSGSTLGHGQRFYVKLGADYSTNMSIKSKTKLGLLLELDVFFKDKIGSLQMEKFRGSFGLSVGTPTF